MFINSIFVFAERLAASPKIELLINKNTAATPTKTPKAIPIFEEYLDKNKEASDYDQIKFYLAISFLSQNETERSARIFEDLAQRAEAEIKEDSKWYLSLAYARIGKTAEAKAQLEELASSEKYGTKASKILNPSTME